MSLHEYLTSQALAALDPPFYALLMAAMRKADTNNARKLRNAFPATWHELEQRCIAPLGILDGDGVDPEHVARCKVDASGAVTVEGEDDERT